MQVEAQNTGGRHESSKIPLKPFLWFLGGLVLAAVLIHAGLIGYGSILKSNYKSFGKVYQVGGNELPRYPAPALQKDPQVDLQNYRSAAEADLNGYGWIDQTRGIVKVPIERAIALLASRGLPVRPPIQDGPTELEMQNQKAATSGTPWPAPALREGQP
jgi:hypothetical protein